MRNVRLIGLTMAFLAMPAAVSAQGVPFMNGGVGIFGGLALPNGDFADDNADEESGYAKMGLALGADAHLPFGTTPFGWMTSVSINTFGVDDEMFGEDADVGRYWLIPIMTGVSYPVTVGTGMSLIPMAQVGLNLALGPSAEDDLGNEADFGTSFSLAFSVGADFMFSQNLGATARYVNGGAPEREVETDGGDFDKDSPMSWLQLGVVYRLR